MSNLELTNSDKVHASVGHVAGVRHLDNPLRNTGAIAAAFQDIFSTSWRHYQGTSDTDIERAGNGNPNFNQSNP